MARALEMRLFALLAARLCHELAGPLAAVGHGLEMLADPDPEFAREAQRLAAASARGAADRLQFYRFAYGFGGEASGAAGTPAELARRYFAATPIRCGYPDAARSLSPQWQRLACNLLLVAAEALPRGGTLTVTAGATRLAIDAEGEAPALAPDLLAALAATIPMGGLTPKTAHAYFCALLAAELGSRLDVETSAEDRVRIAADRND